jgi:hypothetical protein
MSATLVTVLTDTYNYGQYNEEAVESALAQEFPSGSGRFSWWRNADG